MSPFLLNKAPSVTWIKYYCCKIYGRIVKFSVIFFCLIKRKFNLGPKMPLTLGSHCRRVLVTVIRFSKVLNNTLKVWHNIKESTSLPITRAALKVHSSLLIQLKKLRILSKNSLVFLRQYILYNYIISRIRIIIIFLSLLL